MNSTIACPSCQRTLRVPESLLGQAVKCPSCSHTFNAPESVDEGNPYRLAPQEEERLSRRAAPPEDDYDDEPRPSKRRAQADDYDEDYDEAPRRRSRSRRDEKPGKVQAIAIMVLVGGILALLYALGFIVVSFGFMLCWPGTYYAIVLGIMAIIKGCQLLGDRAYLQTPPQGIGIMMIINIVNGDPINLTLGILVLIFLSDNEVKDYFRT
jgi:predicted Zn finger-like uncharacterized protein